ncbi:MAG TPA: amylo-alpha-1,6-glucosidase [Thermoanaerobaculia bacterium]
MSRTLNLRGWSRDDGADALVAREWLVTNGAGGYASGTIAGVTTRRYHGLLIAALPVPLGRTVMLNHLQEHLIVEGKVQRLSGDELQQEDVKLPDLDLIDEFRLELGLPVWSFDNGVVKLTKRLLMPYLQNTTYVTWELASDSCPVRLELRPSLHFRPHEHDVRSKLAHDYTVQVEGSRLTISEGDEMPPLHLALDGADASVERDQRIVPEVLYRMERSRGYRHEGALWTPGTLAVDLIPGSTATFVSSTEPWSVLDCDPRERFAAERQRREQLLERAEAEDDEIATLVLAADQFVILPATRPALIASMHASGDEPRTVIAGYHWFTDWGRDTMISLEGLTLSTGRYREAGSILRTFAGYVRDGLIPNMFPEGESDGVYHTADATMWYFHALQRYFVATADAGTLRQLLPILNDIIDHHLRGTRFGIAVDPRDGLLRQGEGGYQLTWMDAKCDGWVVTPRRGKAVEINALFYNALRLLEEWSRTEGDEERALKLAEHAERTRASFNDRFWYEEGGYLYDVVDGEDESSDAALRPNQIFSISLDHPVLDQNRWQAVVDVVQRELLTPAGLRSLARSHPDYKPSYDGDLRTRDAAYHQGTVWSWLIGPFIDAWIKVHPEDRRGARQMLRGLEAHLGEAGVGSISEVFDAEPPFAPRGCIAQAWGVAELLRCLKSLQ